MNSLNAREQKLVALFILLLVAAGIWLFFVSPLIDGIVARDARRSELALTIERNNRLIAATPGLRRRLESQTPLRSRYFLVAPTRDAAADLLRQRLQRSFEASGASLRSLGDATAGGRWVGASVDGQATLDQLVALLADLQNQSPYLVVTALSVVADRAFQSQKLDLMDVKIDVAVPHSPTP